ncbi:transposase [Chitinophaga sancti]|uniref:transposase n=1 Tax=Chitinophaga sancti TaxID=1004 RepID=UPI0011606016
MSKAIISGVKEICSFVKGLQSDFSVVENAMLLPWSNGQVEVQINKMKTLKRQLYGRASFALLRKMLILQADR